jgi:hypothetical protein
MDQVPHDCSNHGGFGGKKHRVLFGLVLLMLAAWLGLKARNEARQYNFIGVSIERNTIVVSGEGKVTAIPDIATIDLGTTTDRSTVAEAQKENTRIMNAVIQKLGELSVEKKDVQTQNYSISPRYDYNEGRTTLRGYTVSQNLHVKIRNLDRVGDIIGAAGALGVNQIGGISFTIDEPEKLKAEARELALKNAKAKADALAKVVGIKLRRVVSFQESGSEPYPMPMYGLAKADMAMGMGGGPSVEAGSTDVVVNATVTYEIE